MPTKSCSANAPRQRSSTTLAVLTLGVLLAHAALLQGAPLGSNLGTDNPAAIAPTFMTRSIEAPVEPAQAMATVAATPIPAKAAHTTTRQPAAQMVHRQEFEEKVAEFAVNTAQPAIETIASQAPEVDAAVQLAAVAPALAAPQAMPPAAPAATPDHATPYRLAIPMPLRMKYTIKGEVRGFPYTVHGDLWWQHDETSYSARLEVSHFLLGSRVQTSKGELTAQGLTPTRFGDKVRSEVAAHFERSKGKISFSANTPDIALQPGAQDQLSIFMQLAAMVGGEPDRFPSGSRIAFQAVGARTAEQWTFVVGNSELLGLPAGAVRAVKFTRAPSAEFDSGAEVWLAPEIDYLPVRIRLTQANGDFADQLWNGREKP
jgi:hypothetical protein